MIKRRIRNILRRMIDGDSFYLNCSPRITNAEIDEIEKLTEQLLQVENLYGADVGIIPVQNYAEHDTLYLAECILNLLGKNKVLNPVLDR